MTIEKKHKRTVLKAILCFLVIIVACLAFIILNTKAESKHTNEIEQLLRIKFPDSTVWGQSQIDHWMETTIACTFKVDKKDIPLLLKQIDPKEEIVWSKTDRHLINANNPGGWFKPLEIKDFKAMEIRYPEENTILRMLYDDSIVEDSEKVLFYLVWFEVS